MHICGMDFSSLASYWQIKALLMLEPSVVTPQNQYFPANSERMSVHCLESGCIGKYIHLGPGDCPRGSVFPNASRVKAGYGHSLSISREVLIFVVCFSFETLKDLPHSESACTEWALHQPKLL